jgi:zinc D-Ala-D-Ala dipeptidase
VRSIAYGPDDDVDPVDGPQVVESGEPMRDAREVPDLLVDSRAADPAGHFARVRAGVLDRMVLAQQRLPPGWQFALVEGWRPPSLQRRYFHEYLAHLERCYPDWDPGRRLRRAHRVVSLPDRAPHVTGGAIDVVLASDAGAMAWMGTEINAYAEDCDHACRTDAQNISAEAARHRRLLSGALSSVGFVNDPARWWHWSFGDRYWALRTGAAVAYYGPLPEPATD